MNRPALSPVTPAPLAVDYPSSDGKPLAENDFQLVAILYAIDVLRTRYAECKDVYVSGDLLIYYEEGNPRASVAPDVFVVFGAEDRLRMTYKLWEEPKGPDFVLEVASRSTWRDDVGPKRSVYARLGVREYWLYDPRGEYLSPGLQGWRLSGAGYERHPVKELPDGMLTLHSEILGLELRAKGGEMRFRDAVTGRDLLGHREEHAARRAEAAARRAAEARVAELEALLRGKRG